jgi:hypothetical protein
MSPVAALKLQPLDEKCWRSIGLRAWDGGSSDQSCIEVDRASPSGPTQTKSVEEGLTLPRSTVGRWIAKARQAGYLGPSEGGKGRRMIMAGLRSGLMACGWRW